MLALLVRGSVRHTNLPLTCHTTCCEIQVSSLACIATHDLIISCIDLYIYIYKRVISLACIKLMWLRTCVFLN